MAITFCCDCIDDCCSRETSQPDQECVFCDTANIHKEIIAQSENVFIIREINPPAEVHLLAIPKKHIRNVNHLLPSDRELLMEMREVGLNVLRRFEQDDGAAHLVFHCPPKNVVDHLHLNLIVEPNSSCRKDVELSKERPWIRSFDQQLALLSGRKIRKLGFDFDGVLHTSVGKPSHHRLPTTINPAAMVPFREIMDKIKEAALSGTEIYLITAQPLLYFRRIGCAFLNRQDVNIGNLIPEHHRLTNRRGIQKVDAIKMLALDEFYDDSPINIIAVQEAVRNGEIEVEGFRLFQTFPENSGTDRPCIVDVTET